VPSLNKGSVSISSGRGCLTTPLLDSGIVIPELWDVAEFVRELIIKVRTTISKEKKDFIIYLFY
jgi:hypothetical protein